MVLAEILAGLGAFISVLVNGVKAVSEYALRIGEIALTFLWNSWASLYDNSPQILRIFYFLLIILLFGNLVVGSFLQIFNFCNSSNELLKPRGFFEPVNIFFTSAFTNIENNTLTYDQFLANNTVKAKTYSNNEPESIIGIKCINQKPKLALFGKLDIFDFRLWVTMYLIGALINFYFFLNRK